MKLAWRAKRLRDDVDLKQLEEEKRQWEIEKKQLEEDKGMLEMERNQAQTILREHQDRVKCAVCLMLPREDKPVPCCPHGHFVCSTCKDKLIRQQGFLYLSKETELI